MRLRTFLKLFTGDQQLFPPRSTFEEFLVGLSLLTPTAPVDKKTKWMFSFYCSDWRLRITTFIRPPSNEVTFAIYDIESKGRITPANLRFMLSEALKENAVPLSDSQVRITVPLRPTFYLPPAFIVLLWNLVD